MEDDEEMVYRFGEYHGMALRRKRKRIEHILIFLGRGVSRVKNKLEKEEIFIGFQAINISSLDMQRQLSSQIPREVLYAVLANFPDENAEAILRLIVSRLKQLSKTPSELSRYLKQLLILSRIRKFEAITIKIVNDMPITYDEKTDYLYLKGEKEGRVEGRVEGRDKQSTITVINMLLKTNFSNRQVADLAAVTIPFVKKWKVALTKIKLKTIWDSFGDIENNKQKTTERSKAIVIALITIKKLSDEVIAIVSELLEKEVKKIRVAAKKNPPPEGVVK